MFQVGIKWKLWGLIDYFLEFEEIISLRGYEATPPIELPADLLVSSEQTEEPIPGLSVAHIASSYCPTRRDLYLERKKLVSTSKTHKTWGRIAGHVIETFIKEIPHHFKNLATKPKGLTYQRIQSLAEDYSRSFWESRSTRLDELAESATSREEDPSRLTFLLKQTLKYELTLLGADYELRKKWHKRFIPLQDQVSIEYEGEILTITPDARLGISETTTPDFIVVAPEFVVGEVKTGDHIEQHHLHTVAGYALAYESQHKVDVDFGIVYFFETHVKHMNFASMYIFRIDDFLRRKFLDARNAAYKVLQQDTLPDLADYEMWCQFCKYKSECYSEKNG